MTAANTMTATNIKVAKPLSDAQLQELVPSIFTTNKHRSRSERYGHLPTIDVLRSLRKAGFVPVQAFQSRVKPTSRLGTAKERVPYAKHLIRLRERQWIDNDKLSVNDTIPDIILTNSHDGTSSFKLEAGLYRLVCSNGLVIRSESFGEIRVPHSQHIFDRVKEGVDVMSKHVPEILRVTKAWDKIKLDRRQQMKLGREALAIRFHGEPPITVDQVLENRRNDDEAPTLWRTFNTIQENLLMGGQQGRSATGRNTTTRLVTSVNNSLLYNRGLWQLAEQLAKKAA